MFGLITARRFGPLFATQFLGAFNDNLYKTAMLFLIGYRLMADDPAQAAVMVTLAAGLFTLPFLLFSGLAGQIADAHDKARLIRIIKLAEVAIMLAGGAALMGDSVAALMAVLFLMGAQSTFFGPIKYAILPQHLGRAELLAGTGLVEAGTYLAILAGQIAGGLLPPAGAAIGVLVVAGLGVASSVGVPPAPPFEARPRAGRRPAWSGLWTSTRDRLAELAGDPPLMLLVVAISWFWAMGVVLTGQFVALVSGVLGAAETVATLFLTMFSVGIAAGSVMVNRLLGGTVSARAAPWAGLAISLFMADLYLGVTSWTAGALSAGGALPGVVPRGAGAVGGTGAGGALVGVGGFLGQPAGWRILADLVGLSAAAGVFVVPLYALLQTARAPEHRARLIAGNNIVNSLFMVAASLAAAGLVAAGLAVEAVLLVLAAANLVVAGLTLRLRGRFWAQATAPRTR